MESTLEGLTTRRSRREAHSQLLGWPAAIPDRRPHRDRNNCVERTIRPLTLNRKTALFAGHDAGAENWAIITSLIETCKLNALDPSACLIRTLTALVNGHKQRQVARLLRWA